LEQIALLLEGIQPGGIARAIGEGHDCPWVKKRSGRSRSSGCR
jgi:hypothetical protein